MAALLIPTATAKGVAIPNAHGQAIIKVEIATVSDCCKLSLIAQNRIIKTNKAMIITVGVNQPAILSAIFCNCGFWD